MATGLGLSVRLGAAEPIYQQIYDQLAGRIRRGALVTGYRLPATRSLAAELGTHRNTVVRAFEELQATGLVESVVGRGTFVLAPPARSSLAPPHADELPWASLLSVAAQVEPLSRLDRFRRDMVPTGAINLTRMQPSPDLLPHERLRRCLDHVMRTVGARSLGYAPREGLPVLREQLSEHLARSGVPARPEDILVTTGSQQALDLLARALVDPGDRFLVDGTTYAGALNVLGVAGAQLVGVPGDGEGPDVAALGRLARGGAKGLYLMPNCHNPTGASISTERRKQLVAWSHDAGTPIIEDDYGADLLLDDVATPPHMRALDPEVIYVSTFSKRLIPALRVGFMVCPAGLGQRLAALKHAMDLGTSALLQHALAEFLERGYLRAHYKNVLPEYRCRRDALVAALHRHLPRDVHFEVPHRGVALWLELPPELDPEEVYDHARRAGVLVSPSSLHAVGARVVGGVRLTFCAESPARLIEGAKRLGKTLSQLLRQSRRERRSQSGADTTSPPINGV